MFLGKLWAFSTLFVNICVKNSHLSLSSSLSFFVNIDFGIRRAEQSTP